MWQRWMSTYPDLELLELDVGRGKEEHRARHALAPMGLLFMPANERALYHCLGALAAGEWAVAERIAVHEAANYSLQTDIHLLAGAFLLADGLCAEAVEPLERSYKTAVVVGAATRRLYPGLRMLLRISPCLLMPLYPSPYAAALLYAVALWHSGALAEARMVLQEMMEQWGQYDELKLVLGQVLIQRGEYEEAIRALEAQDTVERDALELARCLYTAYAHYLREEYRSAARLLGGAVKTVRDANPLLMARARLLLAECCERNGLLLDALRESAYVAADEVPGDVAAVMLAREERWVAALGLLDNDEVERLARADNYQIYLPEQQQSVAEYSPLDTTRDPVKKLKPREASWLKRQAEERKIATLQAQAARGQTVSTQNLHPISSLGRETKQSITAAQRWWPARREELSTASPRERLAKPGALDVGHVRFDYCGVRETDPYTFTGEKRAVTITAILVVSCILLFLLMVLRTCVYTATY
jgi:hypothetical protein